MKVRDNFVPRAAFPGNCLRVLESHLQLRSEPIHPSPPLGFAPTCCTRRATNPWNDRSIVSSEESVSGFDVFPRQLYQVSLKHDFIIIFI